MQGSDSVEGTANRRPNLRAALGPRDCRNAMPTGIPSSDIIAQIALVTNMIGREKASKQGTSASQSTNWGARDQPAFLRE
jgi:hypothetical protein